MSITRREFLIAGSATSTLWLTGCGGGGSADGAPKAKAAVPGVCTAEASTTPSLNIAFSNVSGAFPSSSVPMTPTEQLKIMGCTNPLVAGVEGSVQELFVDVVQRLSGSGCDSTTGASELIRSLSLHLAIPRDPSDSTSLDTAPMVFNYGDPTDTAVRAFGGLLVVNDPDSSQNWAYQITGGTVEITAFGGLGLGIVQLKLTNVVASAMAAGSAKNNGSGTLALNGEIKLTFEFLGAVGGPPPPPI